jgi:hypothetical protein
LDQAIVDIAKALKENLGKLGVCLDQLLDVVLQHERRLQDLESPTTLKDELRHLQRRIAGLKDPAKRKQAVAEFAILCKVLDFDNLEEGVNGHAD